MTQSSLLFRLRAHQQDAVEAVLEELTVADRAQVTMPCGTGKSLVAVACAVRSHARLVHLVVPTIALIQQSVRGWREALPDVRIVVARSDELVAGTLAGVEITTEPARLATLLAHSPTASMTVVISTYASLPRVKKALSHSGRAFDIAIGDEAHHCAGPWSSPSSLLARTGSEFPAHKRLFLTATRRIDADADPRVTASMDDELAFGRQVYVLSLRAAIDRGLLSDYRIAIVAATAQEWSWLSYRGAPERVPGRRAAPRVSFGASPGFTSLSAQALAAVFALGRHMGTSRTRRVLTFHNRISEARSFALVIPMLLLRESGAPACHAEVIHGGLSSLRRATAIAALDRAGDDQSVVLTNVRCLAEGVDLPSLDAVVFASTRTSTVDIVQAVGRVLRPHPDKEIGTIILPVIVRDGTEAADRLASSSYSDAFRVLSVLRDHDAELAAALDAARRRRGRHGGGRMLAPVGSGPLRIELPEGLSESFIAGFELEILRATMSAWGERFGQLEAWVAEHGTAEVPTGATVDDFRLGAWVHQQRTLYKVRSLVGARVALLETVPGWSWSAWDATWNRMFDLVLRHSRETGGALVGQAAEVDGAKVGQWVKAQRERFHRGQLDAERVGRLEAVPGWVWRLRTPLRAGRVTLEAASWNTTFEAVLQHAIATGGGAQLAQSRKLGGISAGAWVKAQREKYHRGQLDAEHLRRLESIPGWVWRLRTPVRERSDSAA